MTHSTRHESHKIKKHRRSENDLEKEEEKEKVKPDSPLGIRSTKYENPVVSET